MAELVNKQYIIAIGASAGGLEAISSFFDYTPRDSVSYIVIQHLSADFKSQMAQILARHSKLQIEEAIDGMEIKTNKIYLIPSSNFMVVKNGKLILSDKKKVAPPHLTIDHFFSSLAEDCGERAIGVILSGTGNDGSKGIMAIKGEGGLAIVQDPATASFNGMPVSAIATGCADMILSPQAMPQVIEDYVKDHVLGEFDENKNNEINEGELAGIIGLIKGNLPLDFTDYKRPTIIRRIKRRMEQHNLREVGKYYSLLKNNDKEIEMLANDFLIGVTSFFRDPEAFEIIEKTVIPQIVNNIDVGNVLKIWIAGCATGEEAYSMAILMLEYVNKTKKNIDVKIFATDINRAALDIASKGVYNENIEKSISQQRLTQFFTKEGANFKVNHDIRRMLIFAHHDLVKNPPYCNIDLISCRNLLIYMNTILQKKVLSMLHFGLKKDGYLLLGPSESATILKSDFSEVSKKWNILKSNKSGRTVRFDTFSSPVIEGVKTTSIETGKKNLAPNSKISVNDEVNLAILEESGFSGVCTNENLKVMRSFGNPAAYLKKEIFNLNLDELLPDNMAITFKAATHKALKLNEKVVLDKLMFIENGVSDAGSVNIVIKPIFIASTGEKLLLILFTENKTEEKQNNIIKLADIEELTKDHLETLEKELTETKHKLEVAYERIESSNENMQSFNEELLSANEEMQSANEELQSVNEELQTINKEHQITNAELMESNDDLNNYFRSNPNGQLFVDHDLLLKKYSPGAFQHINIRESDIGRPLSNITTNIKFETLIDDIKKVILNDETIVREAESSEGNIYQVMTMPYIRKNSKKADGAIISFYDITELKKLMKELDTSNKSLLRINEDLNNFVYSASHDLNAPIQNIEMVVDILHKKINMEDPDVANLSGMLNKSIQNFKGIINDLAKVGVVEAEMLEESNNENFTNVYNEIIETISERIKITRTTFHTHFGELEIKFPKKNLRSIMLNLITNAIKFSAKDRAPKITITTEKSGAFILLTVKDNGIGVSNNHIESMFKMYQRINKDVEGQGIGLYLIKKIIDASGGHIEVESEVGKGTIFKIFFNVQQT